MCLLFQLRRILLEWKPAHPPKASLWMKDLIVFLKLEKIIYGIRGSTQTFHETWAPLLSYFEKTEYQLVLLLVFIYYYYFNLVYFQCKLCAFHSLSVFFSI